MPTKKRRVGFIPRSDVFDLINKMSFESNLSIAKIINILVEEALYKRGLYNIKNNDFYNDDNKSNLKSGNNLGIKNDKYFSNEFNNEFINIKNKHITDTSENLFDKDIYEKFLMFLQFQEEMKKRN